VFLGLVDMTRRPHLPALDPGSPAQASLPIAPLPPKRSLTSTRLRLPRVRLSFDVRPGLTQSRPMFRGPSWGNHSRVPLRSPKFRKTPGAASR
jgi:hypothetical protein